MKRTCLPIAAVCVLVVTLLSAAQNLSAQQNQRRAQQRDPAQIIGRFDRNNDGVLEASELPQQMRRRFEQLDRNKDGKLTKEELQRTADRSSRASPGRSNPTREVNTPPARGERHRDNLKVGDVAPDFTLADPSGKRKVTLSSFRGQRPVVLIFGSYT